MKFARYLEDNQTPEWKKAYIDFRGLKKCIKEILRSQEEYTAHFSTTDSPLLGYHPGLLAAPDSVLPKNALGLHEACDQRSDHSLWNEGRTLVIRRPERPFRHFSLGSQISDLPPSRDQDVETIPRSATGIGIIPLPDLRNDGGNPFQAKQNRRFSMPPKRRARFSFMSYRSGPKRDIDNLAVSLSLSELYGLFTPQELRFFTMLDGELQKVENFFVNKEKELQYRNRLLSEQLKELANHKRAVNTKRSGTSFRSWTHVVNTSLCSSMDQLDDGETTVNSGRGVAHQGKKQACPLQEAEPGGIKHSNDPEDYFSARAGLRKAIAEHYRELETLLNYRILNQTGFRKALKKFEKVTKILVQEQYMSGKVEQSAFSSDREIQQMRHEMEKLYGQAFMNNNTKKAQELLRGGGRRSTSHHFSTFRSGLCLGMSVPLLMTAFHSLAQPGVRKDIPEWASLLHVYGVLFLPAIFPILIFLNIFTWARFRINYVFIFELDTRTRLDHYKYLELPSFLFVTFCVAMWLSFFPITYVHYPRIWPAVWLGLVAFILLNPFRVWFKDTRYWFLKVFGNLFLSGTRRVEFSDFWLADQLCSFSYTLSGFVYVACAYTVNFTGDTEKCGYESHIWSIQWAVTSLPFFIRFAQCLRRYFDSHAFMYILNAARYGSGILSYLFFYLWRKSGTTAGYLSAWCMVNTLYSMSSCVWDFRMDWSLLDSSSQYPLLRKELVYSNYVFVYYVALIVNIILRFSWIIYIPQPNSGWDPKQRAFIVGFLEILRRLLWNFFRLENEHLGNVDQYRITREVPLPYTLNEIDDEDRAAVDDCLKTC